MATYYTQGLPDGTYKETRYEFSFSKHPNDSDRSEEVYYLAIPGNYDQHDQTGDPTHPEQEAWLNSLAGTLRIKDVWFGTWEIRGEEDYQKLIAILTEKKS